MKNGEPKGLDQKQYRIVNASDMRFPPHLHRAYEVLRVTHGSAHTLIDGEERVLCEGECAIVFPFNIIPLPSEPIRGYGSLFFLRS